MRTGDLVRIKKRNWVDVTGVLMALPRCVGKRYTEVRVLTSTGGVELFILLLGKDEQTEVLSEAGGT